MFIPNEIITDIIAFSDYQTWKDKVKKINQQYYSYYYYGKACYSSLIDSLQCRKHQDYTANWRNPNYLQIKIYRICINSDKHPLKLQELSQINLPHNY